MRVILFRGKTKSGEWQTGYLFARPLLKLYYILEGENQWMVDPKSVGQYTELTDKHGKPIYEGDYIRAVLPASNAQREFVWPIMSVVYSRGAFGLADSHGEVTTLRSFAPYVTFEVVGNIHDNPELVKEEPK